MKQPIADAWITDSGASFHMTYKREWLTEFRPCVNKNVMLGNNS